MQKIDLLDCTIRDGGYVNDWKFTTTQVRECYKACSKSGVDYMEIGYKSNENVFPRLGHPFKYIYFLSEFF